MSEAVKLPEIGEVFEYKGYDCLIKEINKNEIMHHLCGYVRLPQQHPGYMTDYNDSIFDSINVHGGLTFSGSFYDQEGFWVGFDCAHYEDAQIGTDPKVCEENGTHIWTKEDVLNEICKLVDQLQKIYYDWIG